MKHTIRSESVQRTSFPRMWACPGCRTTHRLRAGIHWCSCRPEQPHCLVQCVRVPAGLYADYGTDPSTIEQDPYAVLSRRIRATQIAVRSSQCP